MNADNDWLVRLRNRTSQTKCFCGRIPLVIERDSWQPIDGAPNISVQAFRENLAKRFRYIVNEGETKYV